MDNLDNIFAEPEIVDGIKIFPIELKNHKKFSNVSKILTLSKDMCNIKEDFYLFDVVIGCWEYFRYKCQAELIDSICLLFELVTHEKVTVKFTQGLKLFIVGDQLDNKTINVQNYDEIRKIIMQQNLIFLPKIYKDPLVQEWANRVLEVRNNKSSKITLEDFVTTVKNFNGHTYQQMKEMTIYQLYADFYRIGKFEQYKQASLFSTVSTKPITIEYFAENIDMFKSPYDDVFTDSSNLKYK